MQNAHHEEAPHLCAPFGFSIVAHHADDKFHGPRSALWCNGDTSMEHYEHGELKNLIFKMSPRCNDDRFRAKVIEGVEWRKPHVQRQDKSLTYILKHPDPVKAPDQFRRYRQYFEDGPVEDRDRKDISELLRKAAAEIGDE